MTPGIVGLCGEALTHRLSDQGRIEAVEERGRALEEAELLLQLLLQRAEALLMCATERGEDTELRCDDFLQRSHLTGAGDPRFDEGDFVRSGDTQHGERYADLRIVATGGAHRMEAGREELIEQFLDDGLPVAPRDTDRMEQGEALAVRACQRLQSRDRGGDDIPVAPAVLRLRLARELLDDEAPYPTLIERLNIAVSVTRLRADGEEKRLLGREERAAIGEYMAHSSVVRQMRRDRKGRSEGSGREGW